MLNFVASTNHERMYKFTIQKMISTTSILLNIPN